MAKTKVDIISGFLGAGKTTFIRKLLKDAVAGEQVVLIENEFGEIGIDGGFLKDSGIEIREMNSGCICCSLVGDFASSLQEILTKYKPDRIIIEPSGVGKLSDVMKAVADVEADLEVENNSAVTVVDAKKCRLYMKNFGEFFNNQVQFATTIVLSRTDIAKQEVIDEAVAMIRELNPTATIITTPVALLSGKKLLEILEEPVDLKAELMKQVMEEEEEHEHHHHHHEDEDEHGHHHHHHDDDDDDDEDTTTITTAKSAPADITIIITTVMTRTRSSRAGVSSRFRRSVKSGSAGFWRSLRTPMSSEPSSAARVWCRRRPRPNGCTLTWFRARPRSAPAFRSIPERCA